MKYALVRVFVILPGTLEGMIRFLSLRRHDVCFLFSRMDFPSSLHPTLFMTGPLGLSNVPDMSFMCSWRDALTLPENSQVRTAQRALAGPLHRPSSPALTPIIRSQGGVT